jgi:hypothetical protein
MYVCMYACMYVCMHECMYVRRWTGSYSKPSYIGQSLNTCVHTSSSSPVSCIGHGLFEYIRIRTHTHKYRDKHTHTQHVHTYTSSNRPGSCIGQSLNSGIWSKGAGSIRVREAFVGIEKLPTCTCMYVCICMCMYLCIYVCVRMFLLVFGI